MNIKNVGRRSDFNTFDSVPTVDFNLISIEDTKLDHFMLI